MIGVSIARRMRSGTGVGPGICRKWRPAVREEFWAIVEMLSRKDQRLGYHSAGEGRQCGAELAGA